MIKLIGFHNFQSHRETVLELSDGVNIIIGASDRGKTSMMRGIRWVGWNRPQGDAFRSHWGGTTKVEVINENNDTITRIRNEKLNAYILNNAKFKAIKSEVPQEIAEALNLNDINLQMQFDSQFLLSSSPGEVAQHFNKIAHLDVIDRSNKAVQSWLRQIESDIEFITEQRNEAKGRLSQFDRLEEFEDRLLKLEELEQDRISLENQHKELSKLIENIESVESKINEVKKIVGLETQVNALLELFNKRDNAIAEYTALDALIENIEDAEAGLEECKSLIKHEEAVDILIELVKQIGIESTKLIEIDNLLENIEITELKISKLKECRTELEEKFRKEMPEICPLCGRITNEKS